MNDGDGERSFVGRWSARKRAQHRAAAAPEIAPVDAVDAVDSVFNAPIPDSAIDGTAVTALSTDDASSDVVAPADAPDAPDAADALTGTAAASDAAASDAQARSVATDADMQPIESLDASSDLSAFFSDGVSAALRRAALRQVFRAAPFNVRDGLNDYDGDYTRFEPLGDTITADMKFHTARKERLAREAAERDREERLVASDERVAEEDARTRQAEPIEETASDDALDGTGDEPGVATHDEAANEPVARAASGAPSDAPSGGSEADVAPSPEESLAEKATVDRHDRARSRT